MKYSQIIYYHYDRDIPLENIRLTQAERIAWEILDGLNGRKGYEDLWDACGDADEQDNIFASLVKTIEKNLTRSHT